MKVLFIGGTGVISSACSDLALERGIDLYHLNRGRSGRSAPEGVKQIIGDIRDLDAVKAAIGDQTFDVVVDWIAFGPDHIEIDLALFRGRVGQYIFISSASAYQTPPANLPIVESTPLYNPYWGYSQAKIACEERLMRAYREDGFPITIVRPSHTYDKTKVPLIGRYTTLDRMMRGEKVILHGDGTSLWTLTHHKDFAKGFVGLLGNPHAIGEAFHITSDEVLTWNQIYETLGAAAGQKPDIVHIPTSVINAYDPEVGVTLIGDKANNMVLDNSKIKRVVPDFAATTPFYAGAKEIVEWYAADPARQEIEQSWNELFERLLNGHARMLLGSGQ
ncbi:MAG: SDR family oxidoreductase [Chloroflexota bacterium]